MLRNSKLTQCAQHYLAVQILQGLREMPISLSDVCENRLINRPLLPGVLPFAFAPGWSMCLCVYRSGVPAARRMARRIGLKL